MFKQKGFAPIIVLLLVVAVIFTGFLLTFRNGKVNLPPSPIPTTIPTLPTLDKQDPTNFVIYKYLDRGGILDAKPMGEIAVKVPSGTKITNQQPAFITGIWADVQIGDKIYNFRSSANPGGSPALKGVDINKTSVIDEGGYRFWKDQNGIYAIIRIAPLKIGDYSSSSFPMIIVKTKPNIYFSQAEIDQWKSIINSAKVYQSDPFDPCLLNNSCK